MTAGHLLADTELTPMDVCFFGTWTAYGLNFPAPTAITGDCLLEMDIQNAPYEGTLQGDIPVNTITSFGVIFPFSQLKAFRGCAERTRPV